MTWNCDEGGPGQNCFNLKRRPKFGVFDDCFPRRINFTDVDGLVEIGSSFCMMEWKSEGGSIQRAQHLVFERFTLASATNVVVVIYGDAQDMTVRGFGFYKDGIYREAKPADLAELKRWLRAWGQWADANSKLNLENQDVSRLQTKRP